MSFRRTLEEIVSRVSDSARANIVPISYYTGLVCTAGAVIDDYTAWGLLKSAAFAVLSAGTIKGIREVYNRILPGLDTNNRSKAEAMLAYGLIAGSFAAACSAETYGINKLIEQTIENPEEAQNFLQTPGELAFLQLVSYGILEAGNKVYAGIKHLADSWKKTVRATAYAASAAALALGITASVDRVDLAEADVITPFYKDGIPSHVDPAKLPETMQLQEDIFGKYVTVHLKHGETLYSAVVLRYTDLLENQDVMDAASTIMWRSFGIKNIWTGYNEIHPEDELRIPVDLLSDRYKTTHQKLKPAKKIKFTPTNGGELSGIHVILDAGHGGVDPGAMANGVVEDEIAYDITVRAGKILENKGATVHYLVKDPHTGFTPFPNPTPDKDEVLLTTPEYKMRNPTHSANLRCYLTNDIYNTLIKQGVSPDSVVFTSFHVDALSPHSRGMMVYYPEASLRKGTFEKSGKPYSEHDEFRRDKQIETEPDKEETEAQSYHLAELLADSAASHNIPVAEIPLRGSVHSGRKTYVPAVIRYNPTKQKLLVEIANCTNPVDANLLKDDEYRQRFAEAYADAVLAYYRGSAQ